MKIEGSKIREDEQFNQATDMPGGNRGGVCDIYSTASTLDKARAGLAGRDARCLTGGGYGAGTC